MVLKVRIKVERIDGLPIGEYTAIVNSGFSGRKCEVLIPGSLINVNLLSQVSNPAPTSKLSGGGTSIPLIRYSDAVNVYIIGDDRVLVLSGPLKKNELGIWTVEKEIVEQLNNEFDQMWNEGTKMTFDEKNK